MRTIVIANAVRTVIYTWRSARHASCHKNLQVIVMCSLARSPQTCRLAEMCVVTSLFVRLVHSKHPRSNEVTPFFFWCAEIKACLKLLPLKSRRRRRLIFMRPCSLCLSIEIGRKSQRGFTVPYFFFFVRVFGEMSLCWFLCLVKWRNDV